MSAMEIVEPFVALRDALLRHLPRTATGSVVTLDEDGLQVAEPGVSIADLALMLEDLTGAPDFLPAGLPVADIRLQKLSLGREPDGTAELGFTVRWNNASMSVAEAFPLRLAEVDFSLHEGRLSAVATAAFTVDGLELDVGFELPSQVLELRLAPKQLAGAADLLAKRGLVALAGSAPGSGPKIKAVLIRGSLLFERFVVYAELEDLLDIGPVRLAWAAAEIDLAGSDGSSIEAQAELRIAVTGHPELVLDVDGEVDAAGWRLAGSLAMAGGGLKISELVDSLAAAFKQTAPQLPDVLAQLGLSRLAVAVDTHDQSFQLDVTLDWKPDVEMLIHVEKTPAGLRFSGSLTLGDVVCQVAFDQAGGSVLVGSFDAAGSTPLTLDALLVALKLQSPGTAGLGASLGIRSLALALDDQARLLMAAEVDAGIDLSRLGDLPLVGSLLPKGEPLGLRITPYFMADQFAAAAAARALMPASLALPTALAAGAHVSAALQLGGKPIALPSFDSKDLGAAQPPAAPAPPAAAGAVVKASPGADEGLKWAEVTKSFGPLKIRRIGHAFDKTAVNLAIDAALELAGLSVSVDGLGARYEFATRTLTPHLRGLGIDLKRGPLEIGGAFLNADGDFLGKVVVAARQFSLNAIGGFSMVDGTPSMFAYGVLDMPIGGPPFFFVEGLAAGLGLHRNLHPPTIEQVRAFPLITAAGLKAAKAPPATEQLRSLHDFITPRLGEYFVAAGIKFNSFRLLHGFALLVLTVGRDFELDLIGTADFASPPDLPDDVPALARVQLDLLARIVLSEGLVAVEARLDPRSYVYSPLCHLSGGFAFYAWTQGTRAGDFVLSVGGYHPLYDKPAHYPLVPKVELKYQVTPDIYLKGDAYFALTPSIMMAGGGLHAQAQIGSLHAWADFSVDFWVAWEPFHYDASLHIGIGAQWKCFHTSATTDLRIWGPAFSGSAHVEWFVFSFDLAFGPQSPSLPVAISVAKFMKSFLAVEVDLQVKDAQASHDATLGVTLAEGAIGEAGGLPVVAPASLCITTSSRVPATLVHLGTDDLKVAPPGLGMAPSAVSAISSAHTVSVHRIDGATAVDVSDQFSAKALPPTGFPAALWAPGAVARNALPIMAVSGVELRPAQALKPIRRLPMQVSDLTYRQVASKSKQLTQITAVPPQAPPKRLPRAELAALGLDTKALVEPPRPAGRARIALGEKTGELAGA